MEKVEKIVDIFVGVPCSGKSTYFKKHYKEDEVFVISMDNIRYSYAEKTGISYSEQYERPSKDELFHEKFGVKNERGQWSVLAKLNEEMHRDFYKMTRDAVKALNSGKRVVVDMTNLTKKGRKGIKKWFKKVDGVIFNVLVFEFENNFELIKKQIKIRGVQENKIIGEDVLYSMRESYQPLEDEEGFDSVSYIDGLKGLK